MFAAAAYLTPALVGSSHGLPRHGTAKVVEFVCLFGGLGFGFLVGNRLAALGNRTLLSPATYLEWSSQFEASIAHLPHYAKRIARALAAVA